MCVISEHILIELDIPELNTYPANVENMVSS